MTADVTEKNLTPKQRKAIEGLALGRGVTQVARDAGVSRETVYRWRRQPAFVAELRRLSADALEMTSRKLSAMTGEAAATLRDALDGEHPINARVRAALGILEQASRYVELTDILAQLEEFERERPKNDNAN